MYAKYWKGKRKVGSKDPGWAYKVNKIFIVLHFTAIFNALGAWSTGTFRQPHDFSRHNVLGMPSATVRSITNVVSGTFNRLSAEWDALSPAVQRKLVDDLQAAIRARQQLDGSVKVAYEQPFDDQSGAAEDFLSWQSPLLKQLRAANEENNPLYVDVPSRHPTLSPAFVSPLSVLSSSPSGLSTTATALSPPVPPPCQREVVTESFLLPETLMASFPLPPDDAQLEDTQVLSHVSAH